MSKADGLVPSVFLSVPDQGHFHIEVVCCAQLTKWRSPMKPLLAITAATLLSLPLSVQAMSADEVVQKHCVACHQAGLGGAPKMDDKAAWAPRIATGVDAMTATVLAGKGAMPPKGTCGSCSEDEIRAAVEAMTSPLQ
jgi:cytochrome c5